MYHTWSGTLNTLSLLTALQSSAPSTGSWGAYGRLGTVQISPADLSDAEDALRTSLENINRGYRDHTWTGLGLCNLLNASSNHFYDRG